MTGEVGSWQRVEGLFHRAIELEPARRAPFLDRHCGGDDTVRRQVEELLLADGEVSATWQGLEIPPAVEIPPEIPGYRDLERLGHGGMGTVYVGRRHDRLFEGKAFAIKVLHAHRTDPHGKQRFALERRLLADLDHPNIVRLYDGGELADGRPYLVMDHVDGRPLDQHCRQRQLTIDARLRLFRTICEALHYAHQNRVIHRDIKPSNILVDGEGVPHLLDFGIAKRLGASEEVGTTTTAWRAPMTLAYASPEQVGDGPVTTASDLYALGVVLFELLTGQRPPPPGDRAQDAPRPSEVLTAAESTSVIAAAERRTTPSRLRRRLSGDLDHIVAKTVRRAPEARYGSVRELADDIARHFADQPVLARRGSGRYVFGRFVRRHRQRVAVAGAVFLVLVLALVAAIQSRRLATSQADRAEKDRLVRLLAGPETDSLIARGRLERTIEDILALDRPESQSLFLDVVRRLHLPEDRLFDELVAALRTEHESDARQSDLARIARTLGEWLYHAGHFERAEAVQRIAVTIAVSTFGGEDVAVAPYLEAHAQSLTDLERYPEGIEAIRAAIRLRQADPADRESLAAPLASLASLHYHQGAFAESAAACRQALVEHDRHGSADSTFRADILSSLSVALMELDPSDTTGEAEALAREALATHVREHGPGHMRAIQSRNNLTAVLGRAGRTEQALAVTQENLRWAESTLGPDHPRLAYIHNSLAGAYRRLGRPEVCILHARRSVALREANLPGDSWLTAFSKTGLADCLGDVGRVAEAVDLLRSSIATFERSAAADSHRTTTARARLDELSAVLDPGS